MSRKFVILGESLKHSMSPPIHNRLFELSKKTGDYSVLEVSPDKLYEYTDYFKSLYGYNITIPHKMGIIPLLDELDESARRYNSVNCVHTINGISKGYNTDVYGFLRSLEAGGGSLGGNVLLLGCGGVGRMMAIESCLADSSLTIAVLEHSLKKAQLVKEDILKIKPNAKVEITTLSNIKGEYDLMINSTPVGMYPKVDACPVDDNVISKCSCIFDAVYNPGKTLLLNKAEQFGKKTIGGMPMLVLQAVVAHEIWDNATYNEDDIDSLIAQMQNAVEKDFK